jgi:hypothetical protein
MGSARFGCGGGWKDWDGSKADEVASDQWRLCRNFGKSMDKTRKSIHFSHGFWVFRSEVGAEVGIGRCPEGGMGGVDEVSISQSIGPWKQARASHSATKTGVEWFWPP